MIELSLPPITKGDMDDYSHQTLGEMWNISTSVLVERLGHDKAMDVLRGRIVRLAREKAEAIGRKAQITGKGVDDVRKVRDLLSLKFNKKAKIHLTDEGIEGEVEECPFSNSSDIICLQYHLFLNETLSAMGVPYEMVCNSFMTKGDDTCHWRIVKKGEPEKERVGVDDEALKILRVRLAKGEITPEQYHQLKDILTGL